MINNSSDMQTISTKLLELFEAKTNIQKKTKKITKYLQKNNVPTQILFTEANTLLHLAVTWDLPPLVEHLLKKSPELLGMRNVHGMSPVGLARELRHHIILNLFKQTIFPDSTPPPASKDELAQLSQQFSELNILKTPNGDKPKSSSTFSNANELIQKNHKIIEGLESDVEELLLESGFEYQEESTVAATSNPVWDLCASISVEDNVVTRKPFNKKYTAQMVQALLATTPAAQIVQNIVDLWVAFDKGQKLTAIFILKELIAKDPNHQLLTKEHEGILQAFFDKVKNDFPSRYSIVTRLMNNLVKTKNGLINNPLYTKHRQRCARAPSAKRTENNPSFAELLAKAAKLKVKKQQPDIALIVNEFDALTLSFFHNVELSEYYQCAWQGADREVTSPNIVRHTEFFNQTSSLIQNFILQASSKEEFAARFSLFVRVAARLAEPHDGMPPNLDAIILIMLSIDSFNIARAKRCTELLSADDKKQLEQLRKIVDPLGGFRNYRDIVKAAKFALFISGRVQTEIALAFENEDHQHRLETTGKVLLNFLDFQKEVRTIPFRFRTDLVHQLVSKEYDFDENHQLCLSGQFAPIVIEAMTPKLFEDFLNTIISTKIIPNMHFDGSHYPPEGIIIPVVAKLKAIAENEPDSESKQELMSHSKELLIKLTKLINKQFDLAHPVPKLSPILPKKSNSIEIEQQPTLLLSKKMSDLRRNQSYNTIAIPSKRRKRLSIS